MVIKNKKKFTVTLSDDVNVSSGAPRVTEGGNSLIVGQLAATPEKFVI